MTESVQGLSIIDYAIIAIYLIVIAGIGIWISIRSKKSTADYFIANRGVPQWAVAFTLMATLISSNTLVAHPGVVFQKSMILVPGFLVLPVVLVLVAFFVVPFYRRVVGLSAYEYIGRRFGFGGRVYTSGGFLIDRTFDTGVTLVTTAVVVNVITGWAIFPVILFTGIFIIIYTMIGGIQAVVWTDVVQGIILMGGGALILGILLFSPEAGEPFAVVKEAWNAGKFSFGSAEISFSSLFDTEDRTMWMFMAAMAIIWSRKYICDQNMVQRYLIARSDHEARKATLVGAALSVPILVGFNLVGACLYGYYELTDAVAPSVRDEIFPHFISNFLPTGVVGLILAAILAASMSSISSDLNSIATVINKDYFQWFFPNYSDRVRLMAGRLTVLITGLLAALIAVAMIPRENSEPIATKALVIATIISSGTLGLFLLGFLTKRATRTGAYVGILSCVMFTLWGIGTSGETPFVDIGVLNFSMNTILIGIFGQIIVFAVGYAVSLAFGGYRPEECENLVFRLNRKVDDFQN